MGRAARALLLPPELRISPEQRRSFPPLCPDLVVELASPSDEGPRGISALRQTMSSYIRNGAQLGWLLLPSERAVEIWRSDKPGVRSGTPRAGKPACW